MKMQKQRENTSKSLESANPRRRGHQKERLNRNIVEKRDKNNQSYGLGPQEEAFDKAEGNAESDMVKVSQKEISLKRRNQVDEYGAYP